MEPQKIFVSGDDTAHLTCPHCGKVRTGNVAKFKGRTGSLKIRCACGKAFEVIFEFRKAYRKNTFLLGTYASLRDGEIRRMRVKDISLGGIGFTAQPAGSLQPGDMINVRFILDDPQGSEIEQNATVRWVKDDFVGCHFTDPEKNQKVLGYYLMP